MNNEHISHHPKKIFKNIYDFFKKESKGVLLYDSEISGFVMWSAYDYATKKIPELKNKTKKDFIKEAMGRKNIPDLEIFISHIGEYKTWLSEMKKR